MIKCNGKDRNNNPCRSNCISETRFCKLHQYMIEYTNDMLNKLELCKGCLKRYYFDNDIKTCDNCKDRGEKNRKKYREKVILCKKDGCNFERSNENIYCGIHQLCMFIDETKNNNKKLCVEYVRGCRTQLDVGYAYSKCNNCLEKERKIDNEKRKNIKLKNNEILENVIVTAKYCTTCCKKVDIQEFVGEKSIITKTCKSCREDNKIQDNRRDKIARNKVVRESTRSQYTEYKKNAFTRNLEFELSYDNYVSIVKTICYYCGVLQERGINGIDRINSEIGYLLNNCVSCCQICNYMKRILRFDKFINKIEHILTYQNKINGNCYPECFDNHNTISYRIYLNSAKSRNIEFLLTEDDFNIITRKNCYICGKENTEIHKNGIDRLNNDLGYTIENSKPCCGDCNIMKRIYSFDEIIEKFCFIYERHKNSI